MHQPQIQYYNNSFDIATRHLSDPALCNYPGCPNKPKCKSLCQKHYRDALSFARSGLSCSVIGCENVVKRRELCKKHYTIFLANNRCKTTDCKNIVLADGLCREHLTRLKGKCCKSGCKSTKLKDPVLALCRKHYTEHRKETAEKDDQEKHSDKQSNEELFTGKDP